MTASASSHPAASAPNPSPERPLIQHGRAGAIIRMALVNLLLNLLTLSLWRFWGRTRIRRYLWSTTSAWGDTAEYTGTGRELFIGFLVVLVAVFLPLSLAYHAANTLLVAQHPLAIPLIAGLQILTVLLVGAGLYGARRYKLSRTLWRGIRGGQKGSAWGYGARLLGILVLDVLSLGWAMPWGDMLLARYALRNTAVGDHLLQCDARAKGLYGRFTVLWLSAVLAFVVLLGGAAVAASGGIGTFNPADPTSMIMLGAVFYGVFLLLGVLVIGPAFAWYMAGVLKRLAATTRLDGHAFAFDVKIRSLIWLGMGNWLLTVLSLGILQPWAALRTFRFGCTHLAIAGQPNFAAIHQGEAVRSRTGEGLVAVLDGGSAF